MELLHVISGNCLSILCLLLYEAARLSMLCSATSNPSDILIRVDYAVMSNIHLPFLPVL